MGKHALHPLFEPSSILFLGLPEPSILESLQPKLRQHSHSILYEDEGSLTQQIDALKVSKFDLVIIYPFSIDLNAILGSLERLSIRSIIILSTPFSDEHNRLCRSWSKRLQCPILGPYTFGMQRPHLGLNASLHPQTAQAGHIAFVLQSRSLTASVLDWAEDNKTAFSTIVSLGTESVLGLPQVLDFLVHDPKTNSIALYLEDISDARGFLSALRAASSVKPVVVLKAGRTQLKRSSVQPLGKQETLPSQFQESIPHDYVFTTAIQRAGAVQVRFFVQLFSIVKAFNIKRKLQNGRVAIFANGSGSAQLALDHLSTAAPYVRCATLEPKTIQALESYIGTCSWLENPIVCFETLTTDILKNSIEALQQDNQVDAILVLITPDPLANDFQQAAEYLADISPKSKKPIITCLLGDATMRPLRRIIENSGSPSFRTPELAMDALTCLAKYQYNQQLLLHISADPDRTIQQQEQRDLAYHTVRGILDQARTELRSHLTEPESQNILEAFGITFIPWQLAGSLDQALEAAESIGYPIALKITSPDIPKKSLVQGVQLDVHNREELRFKYNTMMTEAQKRVPEADIHGVTVHKMHHNPAATRLWLGITRDALFGPIIYLSQEPSSISMRSRHSVALELAPINRFLANQLIQRAGIRHHGKELPLRIEYELENILIGLSQLACDFPEIFSVEIHPMLLDESGLLALDGKIHCTEELLRPEQKEYYRHMAIHPYPERLIEKRQFDDGIPFLIRPIRPEDAQSLQEFTRSLSSETRYMRFISAMRELTPQMLKRYTQIDYHHELAIVATVQVPDPLIKNTTVEEIIAVARYLRNPDGTSAEYALVVGDQWQRRKMGKLMMEVLIKGAQSQGVQRLEGFVLANNQPMQKLMTGLGFINTPDPEESDMRYIYLDLE